MIIFFDIDDTLLDSKSAHQTALTRICQEFVLNTFSEPLFMKWQEINDTYLNLYFRNSLSLHEQRILRIRKFAEYVGKQITDVEALKIYTRYHHHFLNHCILFPETIQTLLKLKKHKLGIITNGPVSDQTNKLRHNGIFHYFNPIVISEEVGFAKPRKEIFETASRRSGSPITECIFVGDSYKLDYLGSTAAGMKGLWLDRNNNPIQNVEKISSLEGLIKHRYLTDASLV